MKNNKDVFICYYNFIKETNTCEWLLTISEDIAKETDQSYKLASIQDLLDWTAATNQVFDGIITVSEGNCKWLEYEFIDFCGKSDWMCEYELLWS